MILVGISGTMGSGKSTAFKFLQDNYKVFGEAHLVKFAGPLYDIQEFIYRRISSVYERPEGFEKNRKLLQWIGTDFGRDTISKTLWIDLWKAEVAELAKKLPEDTFLICDDVRFENEIEAVKSLGGYTLKIISNNATDRITTNDGIPNHSSETSLSSNLFDYTIKNTYTLDVYKDMLQFFYTELKKKQETGNN